ncbi:unnamed protein product [Euphydryas editha]|uniref:Uncharacterized protein n=1 Tax=Euphydryas editha TaxID=104508 RepID=A0AAU9TIS6_EUPED|nr:unnamed protein product [Euphydryas editha]
MDSAISDDDVGKHDEQQKPGEGVRGLRAEHDRGYSRRRRTPLRAPRIPPSRHATRAQHLQRHTYTLNNISDDASIIILIILKEPLTSEPLLQIRIPFRIYIAMK